MSAKSQVVGQVKGTTGLMRPMFAPGQLLRDDDLKQGVDYTRELSRLLFRTFFGCGVMCGLVVHKPTYECGKLCIAIDDGVALDCEGDPIHVPAPQKITVDFECMKLQDLPELWVVLRKLEKCCAPRSAICSTDDEETPTVCTREVDWFEIRVLSDLPECVCGCPHPDKDPLDTKCKCVNPDLNCYKDHYDGKCGCSCADCGCEWILLAYLKNNGNDDWTAEHKFRRFIRPVLIRDPQAQLEYEEAQDNAAKPKVGLVVSEKRVEKKQTAAKSKGKSKAAPVRKR